MHKYYAIYRTNNAKEQFGKRDLISYVSGDMLGRMFTDDEITIGINGGVIQNRYIIEQVPETLAHKIAALINMRTDNLMFQRIPEPTNAHHRRRHV
jgi:hydrogenase maturation factor HypF (carbamoyltransferase family)